MNQKIYVFVGMAGSGKSLAVKYLESKGMPSAYFGGITLEEVKHRRLKVNEESEKLVREDLRKNYGKGYYAKKIILQIEQYIKQGFTNIVVDGLYSWSEYKIFKAKYGESSVIIAISAPLKLRHSRLAQRTNRPLTEEGATKRDYAEIENSEKGGPIANADYTIVNDGAIRELQARIDEILSQTKS